MKHKGSNEVEVYRWTVCFLEYFLWDVLSRVFFSTVYFFLPFGCISPSVIYYYYYYIICILTSSSPELSFLLFGKLITSTFLNFSFICFSFSLKCQILKHTSSTLKANTPRHPFQQKSPVHDS